MDIRLKNLYVGIDTHKRTHTAVIINYFGDVLSEITFENKPSAYALLLDEVNKHCTKGITPVFGLEDTGNSGRALAVYLIKKKKTVKNVDSTLSSMERKTKPVANKTDSQDALCIARVLKNRLNELPTPEPQDIYWTLSMLVNRRDAVVKSSTALKNQLHSNLVHHYPSYRKFFNQFDCNTALEFWEKYSSPSKLIEVTEEELSGFLSEHSSGFFGIQKAREILRLADSDGDTTTQYQENRDFMVQTFIRELKHNNNEVKRIEGEIKSVMSRIGYKLETMIGVSHVTAAAIISEIGDIGRFSSADKLANYAGIAPVERSSGDTIKNIRNRRGNRSLCQIFHDLAIRQICCGRNKDKPVNGIFLEYYNQLQAKGKTKNQAIILVMRRLVNIVYGMMKNKTEYIHPNVSMGLCK